MAGKLPTMMVRIEGGTEMRINVEDFDPSKHERMGASEVPGTSLVPNIVTKNPLVGMTVAQRLEKIKATKEINELLSIQEWENKLKEPSKEILGVLEAAIDSLKPAPAPAA